MSMRRPPRTAKRQLDSLTPAADGDIEDQADFLARFWDALVQARPEYERLTKSQRQQFRGSSISGTALSIHGFIAAADTMFGHSIDPSTVLAKLKEPVI